MRSKYHAAMYLFLRCACQLARRSLIQDVFRDRYILASSLRGEPVEKARPVDCWIDAWLMTVLQLLACQGCQGVRCRLSHSLIVEVLCLPPKSHRSKSGSRFRLASKSALKSAKLGSVKFSTPSAFPISSPMWTSTLRRARQPRADAKSADMKSSEVAKRESIMADEPAKRAQE
eukprot:scaffold100024_cov57-Phaeocystis_antarctica.AAC.4